MGFMGSGKSTIGKLLSEKLNYIFIDLDREIELFEGEYIDNIFKNKTEEYFRNIESLLLRKFLNQNINTVISLGGGVPCFNNNIKLIKEKSKSIYLCETQENILNRLQYEKENRPLIKNKNTLELKEFIKNTLEYREKFYNQADFIITGLEQKEILNKILNILV